MTVPEKSQPRTTSGPGARKSRCLWSVGFCGMSGRYVGEDATHRSGVLDSDEDLVVFRYWYRPVFQGGLAL